MMINKEFLLNLKKEHITDNNKLVYNLINTILGEADRKTKTPSEQDYISIMQKIKSDNEQIMRDVQNDMTSKNIECLEDSLMFNAFINALNENEFLEVYLPKQLSIDAISTIVNDLIIKYKYNFGQIMQYMSANYKGLYNGKEVSEYVKSKMN